MEEDDDKTGPLQRSERNHVLPGLRSSSSQIVANGAHDSGRLKKSRFPRWWRMAWQADV